MDGMQGQGSDHRRRVSFSLVAVAGRLCVFAPSPMPDAWIWGRARVLPMRHCDTPGSRRYRRGHGQMWRDWRTIGHFSREARMTDTTTAEHPLDRTLRLEPLGPGRYRGAT